MKFLILFTFFSTSSLFANDAFSPRSCDQLVQTHYQLLEDAAYAKHNYIRNENSELGLERVEGETRREILRTFTNDQVLLSLKSISNCYFMVANIPGMNCLSQFEAADTAVNEYVETILNLEATQENLPTAIRAQTRLESILRSRQANISQCFRNYLD